MEIRQAAESDWPQMWAIIHEVVRQQETFTYDPDIGEGEAREIWLEQPPADPGRPPVDGSANFP